MITPRTRRRSEQSTITDVARRAQVSRATVSRVLNQYPHVRPRVRATVLRSIRALAYRPDQVARSLARRETKTIGLVVADITNPFYRRLRSARGNYIILDHVRLLKLQRRPTAILAANDIMALGALQAAGESGLRVPREIAVVGIDDIQMAAHREIQLTTMAQQKTEMGRRAALGMLEIIREPRRFMREPAQQVLMPTLVVRRTCGALRWSRRAGERAEGVKRSAEGERSCKP